MEQKKKKDKSVLKKISSKLSRDPDPDTLVLDTLGELKDIVGSMRGVFEQFEDGYSKQLDEERGVMQKLESKLPKALQSSTTRNQDKRMERIKGNRGNLSELEDNLTKLELVLSSSSSSLESLSQAYVDTHAVTSKSKDKSIIDLN